MFRFSSHTRSVIVWISLLLCNTSFSTTQAFTSPHTSLAISKTHTVSPLSSSSSSSSSSKLSMWSGDDDEIAGTDRLASCLPYLLPLLDGDEFGRFVYARIPPLGLLDRIFVAPLSSVYHSIPFLSLALFVLISFNTRNTSIPRSVRFNAQQALLIDITLIFPQIVGSYTSTMRLPLMVVEPATNFVYYTFMACVLYSLFSNLQGKKPNQIPIISDAAEMGVGPY